MTGETETKKTNHNRARRMFMKNAALTVGAASTLSVGELASARAADNSNALPLSMAGYRFDRTRALIDGSVTIDRCVTRF